MPRWIHRLRAAVLAAPFVAVWAAGAGAPVPPAPQCVVLPFGDANAPLARSRTLPTYGGGPGFAPSATTGNVHVLVILAEFWDLRHRIVPARFQQLLFGSGTTLRDYYAVSSGGQLDVTGSVFGWVTLPRPQFAYSQGNGGVGSYPDNGQKMAEDAVELAVLAGLDLGDYDADGDGVVDALLVIHSGQGYEWASSTGNTPTPDANSINSHKWVVTDSDFGSGAKVVDYFTCPELQLVRKPPFTAWSDSISTLGVYCHEFGHLLGLPDLYDTNTFLNRMGVWDIMDFGTWNRDASIPTLSVPGALPGLFSAWSRMFLRWVTPVTISPAVGESTTQDIVLESASQGNPPLQLRANPGGVDWTATAPGVGEYFLAEVRTRTGYDKGLPAEGLLLYHVDESHVSNRESEATFAGGGLVVLVPEDNNLLLNTGPADPWPGSQSTFDRTSHPSSDLFGGEDSGVTLAGIGPVSGGAVSALVSVENLGTPPALPFARPHPWSPRLHGDVQIVLATGNSPGASVVKVFDVQGRRIRTLVASELLAEGRIARWDGTDDAGRRVPAGIYLFRAEGAASGAGKLLLLR